MVKLPQHGASAVLDSVDQVGGLALLLAASGLRSGDLLVGVNDEEVDGIDALHRRLSRVAPGTVLTLRIVRRTQRLELPLTAREPPP